MRDRGIPAASARASERVKKLLISARMSIAPSFSARLCIMTTAASVAATVAAIRGSFCKPQTSFITIAPSSTARAAIFDL